MRVHIGHELVFELRSTSAAASPGCARIRPGPSTPMRSTGWSWDVLDLADAAAGAGARFHLVGHDWGGHVSWVTAHRHPARIRSLTVLSRPRSRHHKIFHGPTTGPRLLEDGARRLRPGSAGRPRGRGGRVPLGAGRVRGPGGRPRLVPCGGPLTTVEVGPVTVPTLYLWGDADATVGPSATRFTADFVTGPFRFEVLPGIGHFVTDQDPEPVTRALLSHLARHR